jgi:hypothetical protein
VALPIIGTVNALTLAKPLVVTLAQTPVRALVPSRARALTPVLDLVPLSVATLVGLLLAPTLAMHPVDAPSFAIRPQVKRGTPPKIDLSSSRQVLTTPQPWLLPLHLLRTYFAVSMDGRQTNWRCWAWPSRSPPVSIPSYLLAQSTHLLWVD